MYFYKSTKMGENTEISIKVGKINKERKWI